MPKTLIKFNLDNASESTPDAFQCSTGTFSDSFQLSVTRAKYISIHITVGA